MDTKEEPVVWENNDFGIQQTVHGKRMVWRLDFAIASVMSGVLSTIALEPVFLQKMVNDTLDKDDDFRKCVHRICGSQFPNAHPPLRELINGTRLESIILPILKTIKPLLLELDDTSNFGFLLAIGRKRNWKDNCSICLEHIEHYNMMLRPCGHVFCSQCVNKFTENMKLSTCPNCRTIITTVFPLDVTGCLADGPFDFDKIRPICREFVNSNLFNLIGGKEFMKMVVNEQQKRLDSFTKPS